MSEEVLLREPEVSSGQTPSLRAALGEKLIDIRSGEPLIRWVTGLGIAQILVAVLLISLGLFDLPAMLITNGEGQSVTLPVLAGSLLFMVTAWTWLLAGALQARLLIRLPVLLLFFGLHVAVVSFHGSTVSGWLVLLLALGYVLWHGLTRPSGLRRDLLVIGLGIAFLYLSLIDQHQMVDPSGWFAAISLSIQISVVGILLLPMLMFAGLDLGESAFEVNRWAIRLGAARLPDRLLMGLVVLVSFGKLAWLLRDGNWDGSWILAMLFVGLVGYAMVRAEPWLGIHREPPFALLLTGVLLLGTVMVSLFLIAAFSGQTALGEQAIWVASGVAGVAALAAAWVLPRRRPGPGARTISAFLMIFAAWVLLRCLGTESVWSGLLGLPGLGFVDFVSLDGAVAMLVPLALLLVWLKGMATRSVLAWLLILTTSISIIRGMIWLVQNDFAVPAAVAAGQLAVFGIGLLWDVLTSGDRWTNGDSPVLPRMARVLLYFGYIALTVSALLFFKGSGMEFAYDEDQAALFGLIFMGVPVYAYGLARSGAMLFRQAAERQADHGA